MNANLIGIRFDERKFIMPAQFGQWLSFVCNLQNFQIITVTIPATRLDTGKSKVTKRSSYTNEAYLPQWTDIQSVKQLNSLLLL